MGDFGDFSNNDFNAGDFAVEDPTADFLARERAILGEDADFIASSVNETPLSQNGNNQDENLFDFNEPSTFSAQQIPLPASTSSRFQTTMDFKPQSSQTDSIFSESNSFQAPVPETQVYTSKPVSGSYSNGALGTSPNLNSSVSEVESEFVRNWRSQFQDRIGDRDRREKEKHQQILLDAQKDLEDFQQEYEAKRLAKIQVKGRITSNQNDGCDGKSGWSLVHHLIVPQNGLQSNIPTSPGSRSDSIGIAKNVDGKDTSRLRNVVQDLAISGVSPQIAGK